MNARRYSKGFPAFLGLAILTLTGCNGSNGNATLNLGVSDTPVDGATSVVVSFTGVQVKGSTGAAVEYDFTTAKQVDLMAQQGGNSASLLSGVSLSPGNYQWIRLMVDMSNSSITLSDGTVHPLTIPSGDQTGLKLVSGFTAGAGDMLNFTIDFNLRQAITLASGNYILKPALRLINNLQVGQISGSAAATLTIGGLAISDPLCSPAAYIYAGSNVTPVDINTTSSVQPLETASLALNSTTGSYDYTAAFLVGGAYTVALTCAANDNPATVDVLGFSAAKNVTVTANSTATVDFP
ncbi:MAG TPA: DUF4382 domain-containing protein [Gammaproteobacteria bacterium]|nr:DUF4382 domain-containing protein [Gammaproteobacteria bacterium]